MPFLKTEIRYTLTKHCRTVIKPKYRKINSLTPIIPKLSLSSNFILEQETDENSINRKGKQRGGDLNQTKQTSETPGFELQSAPSDIDLDLESIPSLDVRRAEGTTLWNGRRNRREPSSRVTLENCKIYIFLEQIEEKSRGFSEERVERGRGSVRNGTETRCHDT